MARERVAERLRSCVYSHPVTLISGAAGAGKTTAAVEALTGGESALAWLTVDETDAAPGRLVAYLEAAIARTVPAAAGVATGALLSTVPHAEATGLLVEAVDDDLILVVDDLERIGSAPASWPVIEALIRYAPAGLRIVLLSRRDVADRVRRAAPFGGLSEVGESLLSFSPAEAATALERLGNTEIDPEEAVKATGGWVTGVLFEAWRSEAHVTGAGGEADPLHGYLSSHILDQLPAADRDFLITTSLLDEVSAEAAEALGVQGAAERLLALRETHLPATWNRERLTMRCHRRFREYLRQLLEQRGGAELRRLRYAHGRLLASEGHFEEATGELLAAEAPSEALVFAECSILDLIERMDLTLAEHWLDELAEVAVGGASTLTSAEVLLAFARDDFQRCIDIADDMRACGEFSTLISADARTATLIGWCYAHAGRVAEAADVIELAPAGPEVEVLRCGLSLFSGAPPREWPDLTGGPVDAMLLRIGYRYGRLADLVHASESQWATAVVTPWQMAALRASGLIQRALDLYYASVEAGTESVALAAYIGPMVLVDAGRAEEARTSLAKGRRRAMASGSSLYVLLNRIVEAKLMIRVEHRPEEARRLLEQMLEEPKLDGFAHARDEVDTWLSLALLQMDAEPAEVLDRLRPAIDRMQRSGHLLPLPAAAIYMAEAEWRAGEEERADRAADIALEAAGRQGSNYELLGALADFPAVASRRIDSEPLMESPWHRIGRALMAQSTEVRHLPPAIPIELRDFGQPAILINGESAKPRIAKTYELLALITLLGSADRQTLLMRLFDGRSDPSARAYLRQAIHWLRQSLPEGSIEVEEGVLRLGEDVAAATDSQAFELALVEAARLQGESRVDATIAALELYEHGEYLRGVDSQWVEERRRHLATLAGDGRFGAAEVAYETGRYHDALGLVESILRVDPYREAAWRLKMRVSSTLGDGDGVIKAFQDCERELRSLAVAPSPATHRLLTSLRR